MQVVRLPHHGARVHGRRLLAASCRDRCGRPRRYLALMPPPGCAGCPLSFRERCCLTARGVLPLAVGARLHGRPGTAILSPQYRESVALPPPPPEFLPLRLSWRTPSLLTPYFFVGDAYMVVGLGMEPPPHRGRFFVSPRCWRPPFPTEGVVHLAASGVCWRLSSGRPLIIALRPVRRAHPRPRQTMAPIHPPSSAVALDFRASWGVGSPLVFVV